MENTPKGNQGSPEEISSAEESLTESERKESARREEALNKLREQATGLGIDDETLREMVYSYRREKHESWGPLEVTMKGKQIQFVMAHSVLMPEWRYRYLIVDGKRLSNEAYDKFSEKYGDFLNTFYHLLGYNKFKDEMDKENDESNKDPKRFDYLIDDLL